MKENFDKAFNIVLDAEGRVTTNDPKDPGGLTVWGLSKVYNPEVHEGMTEQEIKDIYYKKYWLVSGCDTAEFPMDIILFDSAVNSQKGGNKELLDMKPADWREFLIYRMQRYQKYSKDIYVKGHIFRVLNLYKQIKEIMPKTESKQEKEVTLKFKGNFTIEGAQ